MKVKNFEELRFQCELAFLEDSLIKKEVSEMKFINLIKPRLNQSSNYLFPSIKLQRIAKNFDPINNIGFINLYSYYKEIPVEYCLHLLFNPAKSKLEEFEKILGDFKKLTTFVECTKIDENVFIISLIMFEEYKHIFYPFINGKYTGMGILYSNTFPYETVNGQKIYSKQYHVINHTEYFQTKKENELGLKPNYLKDIELDQEIDLKKEILNYNYIKNLIENRNNTRG